MVPRPVHHGRATVRPGKPTRRRPTCCAACVRRRRSRSRTARSGVRLAKPWFNVWLPESTVEHFVGDLMRELTPRDIGPGGFVLLFALRRTKFTRPNLRLPQADGDQSPEVRNDRQEFDPDNIMTPGLGI